MFNDTLQNPEVKINPCISLQLITRSFKSNAEVRHWFLDFCPCSGETYSDPCKELIFEECNAK